MVFLVGMNKLVQDNIVDKLIRECNEFYIQADVVLTGSASPSGPLITNKHSVVGKPVVFGELLEPSG